MGEVDLRFPPRQMFLGEVDLLAGIVQCPPVLQSSLQGAEVGAPKRPDTVSQSLDTGQPVTR